MAKGERRGDLRGDPLEDRRGEEERRGDRFRERFLLLPERLEEPPASDLLLEEPPGLEAEEVPDPEAVIPELPPRLDLEPEAQSSSSSRLFSSFFFFAGWSEG